ncbi:MAG: hypothetical protein C4582_08155 [Desulfobacteraceae bacterium]|nr:MAG: hypothetical protein C4582_08155 [Desulfobacteraceae bacterium]
MLLIDLRVNPIQLALVETLDSFIHMSMAEDRTILALSDINGFCLGVYWPSLQIRLEIRRTCSEYRF